MREIKFRAWDGVDYMSKPFNLDDLQLGRVEFSQTDEQVTVMQYTGLKDKNGKEIYEGDVVKFTKNKIAPREVKYKDCGFYLGQGAMTFINFDEHPIEIIGNIYENPELLNLKTLES